MNVSDVILSVLTDKVKDIQGRLLRGLSQLDDDDVNWRPNEESNSIANLVIHIVGNLRQRYVAGIGGEADVRDRDEEFNTRHYYTKGQLAELIRENFDIVIRVMSEITSETLEKTYIVQGETVTVLDTIFGTATHISEHLGQILYISKMRLGSRYEVIWMPHRPM